LLDHHDHVEINVRDEGIGMNAEELKMIYQKFFRAQTEKSAVGGLGLGMAIVKSIVEGHDGKIDIIS
ncbi:MAG: ATP-binding protein, partial [Gammaproteobacteria bacterium]|nr:ATP-binding protein [Gammaproteobacteria bacterium]NIR94271.1 ATP-binding protein [Gammaproteobacteria bacterium]